MASTLQVTNIADLVAGTLKELGRMKIQNIAQEKTGYPSVARFFNKRRMQFNDGTQIQRNIMIDKPDTAQHVGVYNQDEHDVRNLMIQMTVPMRIITSSWIWDETELLHNRGKSVIFNIIEPRRAGCALDLVEKMEAALWTAPASDDVLTPYGIPYWIVKNATTGFNGGAPSGHTSVAGISPTTYAKWKNYSGQYAAVSKTDLIAKIRTALTKTRFVTPAAMKLSQYTAETHPYSYQVNEATQQSIENIGEAQNENLGRDVASMDGQLVIRRNPVEYTPELDGDSTNPVYGINYETFRGAVMTGMDMKESPAIRVAGRHRVWAQYVDHCYQLLCLDRRRNFVFYV